jgi:predicted nucleic acid-binding Zn ribbon protein
MSASSPGPRCPRCNRTLAAWRLAHCVYCGESFPPGLKEGYQEPEALKWIDRPAIPMDAARQLEVMKILPWEAKRKPSRTLILAAGFSFAVFATIFVMLFSVMRRSMPSIGILVLVAGAVFLGYLVTAFRRAYRRVSR